MKHATLQYLAREVIGDGRRGNLYFVTDRGVVVTVSQDYDVAYNHWVDLARRYPLQECALEDRQFGVIASVEPIDEGSSVLEVRDDSALAERFSSSR